MLKFDSDTIQGLGPGTRANVLAQRSRSQRFWQENKERRQIRLEQRAAAETSLQAQSLLGPKIHTEVKAAEKFWDAEDYHMQYLQKGGQDARKQATETIRCYG